MVFLVAQSDSFDSIYSQLSDYVQRRHPVGDDGVQVALMFEPPEVAQFASPGVPLSALLAISGDHEFVIACYAKILDRLPLESDVEHQGESLRTHKTTREELIAQFFDSPEYRAKAVRVELV